MMTVSAGARICLAVCLGGIVSLVVGQSAADERRIVRALPRNDTEIVAAFTAAANQACRPVAAGRSLEVRGLSPQSAADVGVNATVKVGNRPFPVPMARRAVLSVGLTLKPEDIVTLPFLSSSLIQGYLNDHYVCLQVLIRRDLDTGSLCLHDVGTAACLSCSGSRLTESFEPLVRQSLQDTRCLGLYLGTGERDDAVVPGTLVFAVRNPMYDSTAKPAKVEPSYELLFVRAKTIVTAAGDEDLELHSFMTAERRTKLHYLRPFVSPLTNTTCDLTGSVVFTKFGFDGLTPVESALRALSVQARTTVTEQDLNRLAGVPSGSSWLDRPTVALDALIAAQKK